jgi:DNA-binding response OmpR family regulator
VVTSDTHADRRDRLRALDAEVVGKPFTPEELMAALTALGVHHAGP